MREKLKLRKAYSYWRFSHRRQASGDSKRRQNDAAIEACKENNWELDTKLTFADEGVSAFRGKNLKSGKLAAFLDAVDTGRVEKGSILIIEHLDRITREELDIAYETVKSI